MSSLQWRFSLLVALVLGGLLIGGCNTVEGVGQDIQEAGEEIEDAAD